MELELARFDLPSGLENGWPRCHFVANHPAAGEHKADDGEQSTGIGATIARDE